MKSEEIIDGNKIIDTFNSNMLASVGFTVSEMNYHNSDAVLMPVVRHIMRMSDVNVEELNQNFDADIFDSTSHVFSELVDFIKWYNANKKS
jgi:hypothetical protein